MVRAQLWDVCEIQVPPGDRGADALAMRMDDPAPAEMSGPTAVSGDKSAGRDWEMSSISEGYRV